MPVKKRIARQRELVSASERRCVFLPGGFSSRTQLCFPAGRFQLPVLQGFSSRTSNHPLKSWGTMTRKAPGKERTFRGVRR